MERDAGLLDDLAALVVDTRPSGGTGVQRATSRTFDGGIGVRHLEPLTIVDVTRSRRSRSGWWWSSTTGRHVQYASGRQRDCLLQLDADPDVTWIVHSPIAITRGSTRIEPPFAAVVGGSSTLVFTGASGRSDQLSLFRDFAALFDWDLLRLEDTSGPARHALHWLASYRHPRYSRPDVAEVVAAKFEQPGPLMATAHTAGAVDEVLPVVYHMLWQGDLQIDLGAGIDPQSLVWSRRS